MNPSRGALLPIAPIQTFPFPAALSGVIESRPPLGRVLMRRIQPVMETAALALPAAMESQAEGEKKERKKRGGGGSGEKIGVDVKGFLV